METHSESVQLLTKDTHINNREEPFVEDPWSVTEYACMYYMMTPMACNQANRPRFQDT